MRPSSIFILLAVAVLLLHHHLLPGVEASVEKACREAAKSSRKINYDFCVAELRPYPGSQVANQKWLAVIAASLTKDKATSASYKVKGLLANTSDTKTKKCLESCESIYEDLLSDLKTSILAIKEGRLRDAKTHLSAAVDAPSTCEQGFEELKVPSPLNKEDSDLTQISTIALAFTNVLG
ncbi:putative invertase inhibitor [Musa acuminata AAA Group]|uniref:putative invertase inhibitor n=1 Tax=Musa acuminata AAA Group TaxID=214697 RepID=UPI0031E124DD